MRHASAEPDSREQLCRAAPRGFLRSPADSERHHHILESRKLAKQVMKLEDEPNSAVTQLAEVHLIATVNRLTSNYNIATRRLIQRPEDMHQRALAGAARANDGDHLSPLNGEIHAVENVKGVPIAADIRLVDVVCLEYGHRHSCLIASIGKSLDACTDGYTVAIAAIAILAITIHITSMGCVDTGR